MIRINKELDDLRHEILRKESELTEKTAELERVKNADPRDEFDTSDFVDRAMHPDNRILGAAVAILKRLSKGRLDNALGDAEAIRRQRERIRELEEEVFELNRQISELKRRENDISANQAELSRRLEKCENG